MEATQVVGLVSSLVGVSSLLISFAVFATNRRKDQNAEAMRSQIVSDKLDHLADMAKETRDTTREMNKKLDDHGQTLVKHTEQINALSKRVERVERYCDLGGRPEGTD